MRHPKAPLTGLQYAQAVAELAGEVLPTPWVPAMLADDPRTWPIGWDPAKWLTCHPTFYKHAKLTIDMLTELRSLPVVMQARISGCLRHEPWRQGAVEYRQLEHHFHGTSGAVRMWSGREWMCRQEWAHSYGRVLLSTPSDVIRWDHELEHRDNQSRPEHENPTQC